VSDTTTDVIAGRSTVSETVTPAAQIVNPIKALRRDHRRQPFWRVGPWPHVMRESGFTPEHIVETAKAVLKQTACS
jgi:hypothetical protein